MPTIAENLAAILAAQYGRDVRQAIHDSIEQNYDDVSAAKLRSEDATDAANVAADLANTKAGLADTAAQEALDGIISSVTIDGDDLKFTTADSTVHTITDGVKGVHDAAQEALNKAGLADTAADLANTKAGLADTAATLANASTRFQHIKYSDYETPTDEQMNDTEGAYLGVCVTNSPTAPTTSTFYTWNRIFGEKGETGDNTVYIGETEPDNPDIQVWIDPSAGVNYVPPVRGVDYWTAEDIAAIEDYIDTEILGGTS